PNNLASASSARPGSSSVARTGRRPRLTASGPARMLRAMADRFLASTSVTFEVRDPSDPGARWCLDQYFNELDRRFDTGLGHVAPRAVAAAFVDYKPPKGLFLVVMLRGELVGCGALRFRGDAIAELKRMWVDETVRGLGIGRRLLGELERRAAEAGARVV